MDLRAIREDLATVAKAAGFNSWDHQPDDPQALPAAVVGGIQEFERLNRIVTRIRIAVTLYASLADALDASKTLDRAMSVGLPPDGLPGSYLDVLDAADDDRGTEPGPRWRSVGFVSSGPFQRYTMPGGAAALGVELILELTA